MWVDIETMSESASRRLKKLISDKSYEVQERERESGSGTVPACIYSERPSEGGDDLFWMSFDRKRGCGMSDLWSVLISVQLRIGNMSTRSSAEGGQSRLPAQSKRRGIENMGNQSSTGSRARSVRGCASSPVHRCRRLREDRGRWVRRGQQRRRTAAARVLSLSSGQWGVIDWQRTRRVPVTVSVSARQPPSPGTPAKQSTH